MVSGFVSPARAVKEPTAPWGSGGESKGGAADLLRLRLLPGVGDRGVLELERRFGSATSALSAPADLFARVVGRQAANARSDPEIGHRVEKALQRCRSLGIRVVGRGSAGYPPCLHALHDPPSVLFLRGDASLLEQTRSVSVIGARRATTYGIRVARELAEALSRAGVVVVSGLALGIDGAAHYGALDGTGATVAVLGSGPDVPHPRSHGALYRRIVETGLVVSEFLPGEPARPHHFPRRNRVLAALGRAVVVVEAARRSGAFITVDHALDLGREVFAVPGSVESSRSRGTHALLREGAGLITGARELLEDMGWEEELGRDASPGRGGPGLSPEEAPVWAALQDGPVHVDEVARATGLSATHVLRVLSGLEIRGWATRLPGARFVRRAGTREEAP